MTTAGSPGRRARPVSADPCMRAPPVCQAAARHPRRRGGQLSRPGNLRRPPGEVALFEALPAIFPGSAARRRWSADRVDRFRCTSSASTQRRRPCDRGRCGFCCSTHSSSAPSSRSCTATSCRTSRAGTRPGRPIRRPRCLGRHLRTRRCSRGAGGSAWGRSGGCTRRCRASSGRPGGRPWTGPGAGSPLPLRASRPRAAATARWRTRSCGISSGRASTTTTSYFLTRYDDVLPWVYVAASRDDIERQLGKPPRALRVRVYVSPIPPPAEKGDWEPDNAVFERIAWENLYR